jgi:hypothetical protein
MPERLVATPFIGANLAKPDYSFAITVHGSPFIVYRFRDGTPVFRPASFAHAGLKTGVPSESELRPNAIAQSENGER